VGNFLKSVNLL